MRQRQIGEGVAPSVPEFIGDMSDVPMGAPSDRVAGYVADWLRTAETYEFVGFRKIGEPAVTHEVQSSALTGGDKGLPLPPDIC